jgi:hypothetical protein
MKGGFMRLLYVIMTVGMVGGCNEVAAMEGSLNYNRRMDREARERNKRRVIQKEEKYG